MFRDDGTDCDRELTCAREKKKVPICAPKCVDPKAYCKHRTACPIYLLEKEDKRNAV